MLTLSSDRRAANREAEHIITPSKSEEIARPAFGKWLACIAAQDDLLVRAANNVGLRTLSVGGYVKEIAG